VSIKKGNLLRMTNLSWELSKRGPESIANNETYRNPSTFEGFGELSGLIMLRFTYFDGASEDYCFDSIFSKWGNF